MSPEKFVSLAWDEISKHGHKVLENSDCVCRTLNGVYILCEGHKKILEQAQKTIVTSCSSENKT